MSLLLCVVTTFFIPTAKQVIGGRKLLGMLSMRASFGILLPSYLSTAPIGRGEPDRLPSITMLERTSPVFWFRTRSTPSIPPTTKVDLSFRSSCNEYMTFGLTRLSHKLLIVLPEKPLTEYNWSVASCKLNETNLTRTLSQ